jgi:hypothetical protein
VIQDFFRLQGIKVLWRLNWDSQQGRLRTTSILVRAFWNFKLKVLKYSRNCSLHNTLIPNPNVLTSFKKNICTIVYCGLVGLTKFSNSVFFATLYLLHSTLLNVLLHFSSLVLSAMIRGAHDGQNFIVTDYKEEDLEAIFKSFFKPEKTSESSWKRECYFHEEGEFCISISDLLIWSSL